MADFKWYGHKLIIETTMNAEKALDRMSKQLTGDIKRNMKPGAHNPWPSKKGDGSTHWSSTPGKAPAPDTHALEDSISYATSSGSKSGVGSNSDVPNVGTPSAGPDEIISVIGTQDEKGLFLEMGVRENNVAPRPFIRTALPRNKNILTRIFLNTMKRTK